MFHEIEIAYLPFWSRVLSSQYQVYHVISNCVCRRVTQVYLLNDEPPSITGAVIAAVKCLKVFIRAGGELNT